VKKIFKKLKTVEDLSLEENFLPTSVCVSKSFLRLLNPEINFEEIGRKNEDDMMIFHFEQDFKD